MLKALLLSLVLVCTTLPQYSSMYYYYNNQPVSSGSGGGSTGTPPLNPSTLSLTHWLDENERANNSWGDKQGTKAFGDGGATSYYAFTQNSLTYYECDGAFTPFFVYDTGFFAPGTNSFSWAIVYKTRAAGSSTNQRVFYNSSDDPEAFWGIFRDANVKAYYYMRDDAGTWLGVTSATAINDNEWKIAIITCHQEANNGIIIVYQNDGNTSTATANNWILSNFNQSRDGSFLNGGGGTSATWTGTAEMLYKVSTIWTKEQANGIGKWLADKWDITWTDN